MLILLALALCPLAAAHDLRSEHYLDGRTPFHDQLFQTTSPPPQDPTAGCKTPLTSSSIIVPIGNGSLELSSAEQGVVFDIDGDGDLEFVAWPEDVNRVAFLAMDRNGDGAITSGKELFGNITSEGAPNGVFALMLLEHEAPSSSLKAGRDRGFDDLLLWFDRNRDGISQERELERASDYLSEISLHAFGVRRRDEHGNLFYGRGWVKLNSRPTEKRPVYDVFLLTRQ